MIRTKIGFFVAVAVALTLTAQEGNSASFKVTSALKESAAEANLAHKIYGCHTNCLWGWYRAGNGI